MAVGIAPPPAAPARESGGLSSADLTSAELGELLELSQGIAGSLEFEKVLDEVVRAARKLLQTDMSTLLMADEERRYLTVAASAGMSRDVARRLSTPMGTNLAGLAAQRRRAIRTTNVACDERSTLAGVCAGHITSCMLVPMVRHGRLLGVLGVEARHEREFSDREQCVLQLLADHAATAIETAALYKAEHERAEELDALLKRLHAQNDVMRRGRDAHDRLAEVALEGAGHATLLKVLVELVPAPIAIVNQFGALLCAQAPEGDDRLQALWERCAGTHAFGQHLADLRENVGLTQPGAMRDAGFWRSVPVLAAGELLGAIVVLDHARLEELHMVVLEEAATIVAADLLRERSIAEVEARAHGDLVRALLSPDGWGSQAQERAALLGHDLTEGQCVIAVQLEGGSIAEDPAALLASARRAAARGGLRSLTAVVDGTLAVILTSGDRALARSSAERWIADFREQLATRAPAAQMTFGVSPLPSPPSEIAHAFSCACQALAVCRLGAGQEVTWFDDVDLIATLIDITNQSAVGRYIEQRIGKLRAYDALKHTDLTGTLEVYLDCSGVARHAAKALYLHPHSLRYRLRRIAEIQGLDLQDPMTRLSAHLALKLRALTAQAS